VWCYATSRTAGLATHPNVLRGWVPWHGGSRSTINLCHAAGCFLFRSEARKPHSSACDSHERLVGTPHDVVQHKTHGVLHRVGGIDRNHGVSQRLVQGQLQRRKTVYESHPKHNQKTKHIGRSWMASREP